MSDQKEQEQVASFLQVLRSSACKKNGEMQRLLEIAAQLVYSTLESAMLVAVSRDLIEELSQSLKIKTSELSSLKSNLNKNLTEHRKSIEQANSDLT